MLKPFSATEIQELEVILDRVSDARAALEKLGVVLGSPGAVTCPDDRFAFRVDDGEGDLGDNVPIGREAENRALGIGGECRSRLAGLAEQGDGGPPSGGSTQARMILVRRADRRARDGGWR